MIQQAIQMLVEGQDLDMDTASAVMEEIMGGQATSAQFGAFVTALRLKGETVDEIAGLARVMRDRALQVDVDCEVVDTCGTGGDVSGSFNVSTAAAFVVAGAGLPVAKHGNRAMTSRSGSADVMEALGVKLEQTPEQVARGIQEVGIGFMYAPTFHPAMRFASAPRREIGIRTVFNILGPLTNPARAKAQLIGVADPPLTLKMAQVLERLGCRHALVVHGHEGLDEISICGPSSVCELHGGRISSSTIHPHDMGLNLRDWKDIRGGSAEENAERLRRVLAGEEGALRDITLANAAAALVAGEKASDLKEGVAMAAESIDSGEAARRLEALVELSRSFDD